MELHEAVADLPLVIEGWDVLPAQLVTNSGWTRRTSVLHASGCEATGRGEDVTYEAPVAEAVQRADRGLWPTGRMTFAEYSGRLDELPLFSELAPLCDHLYTRWAFESAGLDLALLQAGRTLPDLLGREPGDLRYVVSLGLGAPPTVEPLRELRDIDPGARFKVDFGDAWTRAVVDELADFGGVDTLDLKGCYRGSFRGPAAAPELYAACAEALPDAWLEDPDLTVPAAADALAPYRERITWDAVLYSLEDIEQLPFAPRCVNVKPSRFGTVRELSRVYAHCERRGIRMYSGGQFELSVGRRQLQELASLFHPGEANDASPVGFHSPTTRAGEPPSPLPAALARGFGPVETDG